MGLYPTKIDDNNEENQKLYIANYNLFVNKFLTKYKL